ncbi:CCR4-NOT transcription complex subunit 10-like [Oscarella lobularis]|uniref:CCR4-NOT transcription complex subunit 10-like n=1 Tax=Oscarella lobularis TaxID=121494 RepID=UPI00331440C1
MDTSNVVYPSSEDDRERNLAAKAYAEFEGKNYSNAVTCLLRLAQFRQLDPRVMHNNAVASYYNGGLKKTDDFLKGMRSVETQLEKCAADTDDEVLDVERAVIVYNQALVQYHTRQYRKALSKLESLFKVIEPLVEERLGRRICFLLIEIYLRLYQNESASKMIAYVEKTVTGAKSGEKDAEGFLPDPSSFHQKTHMENLPLLYQYKARLSLALRSMKACKRDLKLLMDSTGGGNQFPLPLYLKAQLEFVRQNYRKSTRLLNSAPRSPAVLPSGESLLSIYFNNLGCIHASMKKHNLAAYYFRQSLVENDRALASFAPMSRAARLTGRPLTCLGLNRRYELLYNLGSQLLHCGDPVEAFDCLLEAVQVFHTNSRLWLRLAECCIRAIQKDENVTIGSRADGYKSKVIQSIIGSGLHQKVIVASYSQDKSTSAHGHGAAMPTLSLEFANICLRNAWQLLPRERDGAAESAEQGGAANGASEVYPSVHSIPPIKFSEVPSLKCSILACSAFISLCLGDYVMALEYGTQLLARANLSGLENLLGHLYVAEALINLGRLQDALQHLSMEIASNFNLSSTDDKASSSGPASGKPASDPKKEEVVCLLPGCTMTWNAGSAKAILFINLAVAYTMRKEYDKARKALQQASSSVRGQDLPPQGVLLAVFLELQAGNVSSVLHLLKRNQTGMAGRSGDRGNKKKR